MVDLNICFEIPQVWMLGQLMIDRPAIACHDSSFCTAHLFLRKSFDELVLPTSFAFFLGEGGGVI